MRWNRQTCSILPMSPTAMHDPATSAPHAAKRSAAIFSVIAAGIVTLLKLLTGLLTGSLGMLSEAAHSAIDLIASAITLFSVQVADRPAPRPPPRRRPQSRRGSRLLRRRFFSFFLLLWVFFLFFPRGDSAHLL